MFVGQTPSTASWFDDRVAEADWVVAAVANARTRGARFGDVAIVLPSARAIGLDGKRRHAAFTDLLTACGIPWWLEGGRLPLDRPALDAIVAHARAARVDEVAPSATAWLAVALPLPGDAGLAADRTALFEVARHVDDVVSPPHRRDALASALAGCRRAGLSQPVHFAKPPNAVSVCSPRYLPNRSLRLAVFCDLAEGRHYDGAGKDVDAIAAACSCADELLLTGCAWSPGAVRPRRPPPLLRLAPPS